MSIPDLPLVGTRVRLTAGPFAGQVLPVISHEWKLWPRVQEWVVAAERNMSQTIMSRDDWEYAE